MPKKYCAFHEHNSILSWLRVRYPPYQPKFLQVLAANSIIKYNVNYDCLPSYLRNVLISWHYTDCVWCGTERDDHCKHCNRCIYCCLGDGMSEQSDSDTDSWSSDSWVQGLVSNEVRAQHNSLYIN